MKYTTGIVAMIGCSASVLLASVAPERGFTSAQPAMHWENALATGNGKYGALVYGQPLEETIVLNHARLYLPLHPPLPPPDTASHLPEIRQLMAAGQYQRAADLVVEVADKEGYGGKRWTDPFIPACDIRIGMASNGPVQNYSRSVDFATGVAAVNWQDAGGAFERRVFVSRADDVVVLSLRSDKPGAVNCELGLTTHPANGQGGWGSEQAFRDGFAETLSRATTVGLTYRARFQRNWPGSLQGYEGAARVVVHGGTARVVGEKLVVCDADEVLVLTRIELLPDFARSAIPALETGLKNLKPDYAFLLARHAKIHGGIFNRARLDLGGGNSRAQSSEALIAASGSGDVSPVLLEKLFDAGRYNILCSSGDMFPNLQGIWSGTYGPPWSGDFTMNGNLQTALAGDLSGNMAECLLPYFDFLEAHLPEFRTNARRLYGCRGIHVPSRASTHGLNNHFDGTWPMTFWTAGAAWAAQFYYDYYLHTGDRKFLRERALPFMKEAALFYEDFLVEGTDGKYLFSPSYSPENHPGNNPSQACINATMDVAAARELLNNAIAACEILNTDAAAAQRWHTMLKKLPDCQINADGAVKEWTTPLLADNDAHRHSSHLYALYNGLSDEIATNAALRRAFGVALQKRMDVRRMEFAGGKGPNGRPPGEMAFGLVQLGLSAASLRESAACGEVAGWLARHYWNPNLVSTHNPRAIFNTDISGGFPALISRMLVDSQPGWIELLPALPADWPAGQIEGLRCRGQIEARELAWTKESVRVVLQSELHQTVEVRGPDGERRRIELPRQRPVAVAFRRAASTAGLDVGGLRNPVWVSRDNLRDPSVLKTKEGYHLFYSRLSAQTSGWGNPTNWHIAQVFTKDFVTFTGDRNISPPGCASPGDVIRWHGRWVLPYQTYPTKPTQLVFAESTNLVDWSTPRPFLTEAMTLPWNELQRVIDPSFLVDGDTLHCWFVGSANRANAGGDKFKVNLMGHAITRDPKLAAWEIVTTNAPLIGVSERAPDGVENTMVFRTGDHWTMIYSEGLVAQHLARATSADLIHWKLEGPIELPRQKWLTHKYGAPFVWRDGSQWLMILMGSVAQDRTTFGILSSVDGKQWSPLPEGSNNASQESFTPH